MIYVYEDLHYKMLTTISGLDSKYISPYVYKRVTTDNEKFYFDFLGIKLHHVFTYSIATERKKRITDFIDGTGPLK